MRDNEEFKTRNGKFWVLKNNTNLRKELAMARLKKRGAMWYARVQWRDENGQKKDKQIPLRTKSKVTARERLVW